MLVVDPCGVTGECSLDSQTLPDLWNLMMTMTSEKPGVLRHISRTFLAGLLAALPLTLTLAVIVWRRRPPGGISFVLLMLAVSEWLLAYALELGEHQSKGARWWAVALAATYTWIMLRVVLALALLVIPLLPLGAVGVADVLRERRAQRRDGRDTRR